MTDINHRYIDWLGQRLVDEFLDDVRVYVLHWLDVGCFGRTDGKFSVRLAQLMQCVHLNVLTE